VNATPPTCHASNKVQTPIQCDKYLIVRYRYIIFFNASAFYAKASSNFIRSSCHRPRRAKAQIYTIYYNVHPACGRSHGEPYNVQLSFAELPRIRPSELLDYRYRCYRCEYSTHPSFEPTPPAGTENAVPKIALEWPTAMTTNAFAGLRPNHRDHVPRARAWVGSGGPTKLHSLASEVSF
jgi:hypothetical protein